jgi:hypothetical protein
MPVFQDRENKPPAKLFPDGDYTFTVVDCDFSIGKGTETNGCPQVNLELAVDGADATAYDTLTDDSDKMRPKCAWRIDVFLKCCGIVIKKGEAFEFRQDEANHSGVRYINPIGLRGAAYFAKNTYTPKGSTEAKSNMKVRTYYTDRPKLPPDEKLRGAADAAAEAADENTPF